MARHKFPKGHKFATGGARPGSGQPSSVFKAKCRELVDKGQLVEMLHDMASGKDFEQKINENGETVAYPCHPRDRREAAIYLIEHGYGKPLQSILEVGDEDGTRLRGRLSAEEIIRTIAALEGGPLR